MRLVPQARGFPWWPAEEVEHAPQEGEQDKRKAPREHLPGRLSFPLPGVILRDARPLAYRH